MNRILVSFVIAVLNGEKDIGRCLASIRSLGFPADAIEVIVVDNGSTDRTPQIVQEFEVALYIFPSLHVSGLRNRGAGLSHGAYIAFVDADVELMPWWLRDGLPMFDDCRVVATGCFPGVPHAATWVQRIWDIHQRGGHDLSDQREVTWLPSMNLLVRRNAFFSVGGFNENLETAEDVDLCYRLKAYGVIIRNPAMSAVHWGEAKDLRSFWRKEVWRGQGNLKGLFSHEFRWEEMPSVCFPLFNLGALLLLVAGFALDVSKGQFWWSPITFTLLLSPSLYLGALTVMRTGLMDSFPQLVLLYFVYGVARAYSVIRRG
jgi:glycosyltransferase involved in cell wall biosynthesis